MSKVFPDRRAGLIEDLPDNDPIFLTLYDVQERLQIPGARQIRPQEAHLRGRGRQVKCRISAAFATTRAALVVVICHNMDLGDGWEHADESRYPGEDGRPRHTKMGLNYFVYDLTH